MKNSRNDFRFWVIYFPTKRMSSTFWQAVGLEVPSPHFRTSGETSSHQNPVTLPCLPEGRPVMWHKAVSALGKGGLFQFHPCSQDGVDVPQFLGYPKSIFLSPAP